MTGSRLSDSSASSGASTDLFSSVSNSSCSTSCDAPALKKSPPELAPWAPLRIRKKAGLKANDSSKSIVGPVFDANWDLPPSRAFLIVSLKNAKQRERIKRVTGQDYLFL